MPGVGLEGRGEREEITKAGQTTEVSINRELDIKIIKLRQGHAME